MRIAFYIFYAFAWLISLLPFRLLHVLADVIYVLMFYVFRYRRSVTENNLRRSFPEKDDQWIKKTSKQFYHSLADIILEDIKVMTVSQSSLARHYQYINTDIYENIIESGKSVIIAIGHCGNWEWLGNTYGPIYIQHKGYAIVKPLSNPYFDKFINSLRNRFIDDSIIYMKDTLRVMVKRKNIPSIYVFAADQTPSDPDKAYWGQFLNQDTPFYTGIEKIARSLDLGVIFIDLYRKKRGYYIGEISLITDSAKSTAENEITEAYIRKLEEAIRKRPHNWLWSHRRWKHKRNDK